MEARFCGEVASIVEVAIRETVRVFRDAWGKRAQSPTSMEWDQARVQDIEKDMVVKISKLFEDVSSELLEENEALRTKVERLEDVWWKKAGQLERELVFRVSQLGEELQQLERELNSITGNKPLTDASLCGGPVLTAADDITPNPPTALSGATVTVPKPVTLFNRAGEVIANVIAKEQVVLRYPSHPVNPIPIQRICPENTSGIVESIIKENWRSAAHLIVRHKELFIHLKYNILQVIENESKTLCNPNKGFMLWRQSADDLKAFSFAALHSDLQRMSPFIFSIFNQITNIKSHHNQSLHSICTAAAIALRGREPRLSAFAYYVDSVLLQFGVDKKKNAVFDRLSKLGITTSYRSADKKRMALAKAFGNDFWLANEIDFRLANEHSLNSPKEDGDTDAAEGVDNTGMDAEGVTRTSTISDTVRDLDKALESMEQSVSTEDTEDLDDAAEARRTGSNMDAEGPIGTSTHQWWMRTRRCRKEQSVKSEDTDDTADSIHAVQGEDNTGSNMDQWWMKPRTTLTLCRKEQSDKSATQDEAPDEPKRKKRKQDTPSKAKKRRSSACPEPEGSGSEGRPDSPSDRLDVTEKGEGNTANKEFVRQVCEQAGEDLVKQYLSGLGTL